MNTTVGVDFHSVADTERSLAHFGWTYARRLFSDEELKFVMAHPSVAPRFLSERFAAREAVLKLLELSDLFAHWREISVVTVDSPIPRTILFGSSRERAIELGFPKIHLTMSSTRQFAIAVAIADLAAEED